MKINAVLTDFDGVIRHFPKARDEVIENKYRLLPGLLSKTAFQPDLLDSVISGKISDEEWRCAITTELSKSMEIKTAEAAVFEWSAFSGMIDQETLELILSWKRVVPVSLLTNATSRLNQDLLSLGIQDAFTFIINSSEVGYCKPDKRIFEHAVRRLGVRPSEILFVDDSISHTESAKTCGFMTHHFLDLQGLRSFSREITFERTAAL